MVERQCWPFQNPTGTHFEYCSSHGIVEPWSTDLGPWWSGADLGHDGAVISPDMNEEMGKEMEMGL
jgi:hypothetical protein